MKKCLLFFLALVMTIAIALLTESPVQESPERAGFKFQATVNYADRPDEMREFSPAGTASGRQEGSPAQTDNP